MKKDDQVDIFHFRLYIWLSTGKDYIIITKLCFSREANHGFFAASSLLIPSSLFFVSETMFFILKNSIWVIFVVSMSFFKMLMLSFTFLNPWKISYNSCLKVIVY